MSAMYTPPMRLLNVEKMMRAKSPLAARTAVQLPRKSSSGALLASRFGSSSGIRMKRRCTSTSAVNTIAMSTVHPIPSSPIESPLKTLVTRNARPCTVPTRPFAFACRSCGTSSVTVVDRAMFRMFSMTPPNRMTAPNTQNIGLPRLTSSDSGISR